MGDPGTTGARCTQCSALLRPGAPWCTQCYAATGAATDAATRSATAGPSTTAGAVRPAPRTPPAPDPHPVPLVPRQERWQEEVPALPAVTAVPALPQGPSAGAAWPCDSCAHPNPLDEDVCAACGTRFLAAAREGEPALVLPVVGDLATLSTARRFGVALALLVALLVVTALLGLLLT